MRLTFLVLAVVILAGCKQQPPRQPKVSNAVVQRMRAEFPGMTKDCLNKYKWGGIEAMPNASDQCFKFSEPKRMQGLWRNDFEGSEFCEASAWTCPDVKVDANPASFTWLEMRSPLAGRDDTAPGGLYAIDFIGRRSVGAGLFGHFGMAKNEMIVDRLISIREVDPPPQQPTKAEFVKEMKACEARKTCFPNWSLINDYDPKQIMKAHAEAYSKECAGKPICMPNSEIPKSK